MYSRGRSPEGMHKEYKPIHPRNPGYNYYLYHNTIIRANKKLLVAWQQYTLGYIDSSKCAARVYRD